MVSVQSGDHLFGLFDDGAHDVAGGDDRRDGPHGLTGGVALSTWVDALGGLVASQMEGSVAEGNGELFGELLQQRRVGLVAIGRLVSQYTHRLSTEGA